MVALLSAVPRPRRFGPKTLTYHAMNSRAEGVKPKVSGTFTRCYAEVMGRASRVDVADRLYHTMNRGNGRMTLFADEEDFAAFERVLEEAVERYEGIQLIAYCLMPNHWHLILHPTEDAVLSRFMAWLTLTHTKRWHKHRGTGGEGHLYQGRYRSFIVQRGPAFVKVCRYVERNALRANLVERAEDWRWGSLWRWRSGTAEQKRLLSAWPDPPGRRPARWVEQVNRAHTPKELEAIRLSAQRGRPFGDADWMSFTIERYGLQSTLRARGGQRNVAM